jgi:hypothetical protein
MAEYDPVQVNLFHTNTAGIIALADVKKLSVETIIKAFDDSELLGLIRYNGIEIKSQGELKVAFGNTFYSLLDIKLVLIYIFFFGKNPRAWPRPSKAP